MNSEAPIISTQQLQIGFSGRGARGAPTIVASEINVSLNSGELVCLLGPNGSGKSTLIRTLSGLHNPLGGEVFIKGQSIEQFSYKQLATRLSTVLTDRLTIGNLSVYELVAFGRSPYTGWFGSLSKLDKKIVKWAIESMGIEQFVERDVMRLSDGERQKVMIARALAQDTDTILLDEPTAHLDLPNRVEIMRLLRKLVHDTAKAIILSTHELDLALKAADVLWLMTDDGKVLTGTPEDLVLDGTFESVFKRDSFDFDRTTGSFTLHQPSKEAIYLSGDPIACFWTRRALERQGYQVAETQDAAMQINVKYEREEYVWEVSNSSEKFSCASVRQLLAKLES